MATSGLTTWSPDVADTIDEAFERCGIDPSTLTARHLRSARRSFNYMFSMWANLGVHLWAVDYQTQVLTEGDATYNTPTGTIAVLEMVLRRNSLDTPVFPMARDEFLAIPDKTTPGMPSRFWLDRATTTPVINLWNVPENSTDTICYYRMRQLHDITASAETADAPYRWQEAIASGLAARLAEKYAPVREQTLTMKASAALALAKQEDRERTPTTFSRRRA